MNLASEKRAHRRFRTARVQLRVPDRTALNAALRDVSEGGLFIETASPPHVGETARVELFPPGWPTPLLLSGVVVRAELTGYALRLDTPSEKSKAQLKVLVAQVANELTGPAVKSVTEAQQRLGEMEAELRDTKDKLSRVQQDAESNRAYLERALAQAGGSRKTGNSNLIVGVTGIAGFFAGIIVATIISVVRAPPPPTLQRELVPRNTASPVRALDEAGPRRPAPLPMAAIFNGEEAAADAGTTGSRDPGTAVAPSSPAANAAQKKAGAVAPRTAASSPGANVGKINFLSSAPASVLIDDEKIGTTPLKSVSLKPGTYKLQFQCSGGTPSEPRTLDVLPFSETDVEHRCQ
jgi:hypothetical protein